MDCIGIHIYRENGQVYIKYNDIRISFEPLSHYQAGTTSYLKNGTIYASVVYLANLLGWTLDWYDNTKTGLA